MLARGELTRESLIREPKPHLFLFLPLLRLLPCKFGLTFKFSGKENSMEFVNEKKKSYVGRERTFYLEANKKTIQNKK